MIKNVGAGLDLIGSEYSQRSSENKAPVATDVKTASFNANAILVDESSNNNGMQLIGSNSYQPQILQGVIPPSPEDLNNLLGKFEQFQTQFSTSSTNSVHDSYSDSNDLTTIAMIMWILQDLLPKLMSIMNKLNMSLSELSNNNFALEVANAKVAFEYSKEANKQTKSAAMQSFTAEIVGASIDASSGIASLVNTVKNNQSPVENYYDKKNSFNSLKEKNDLIEPILGASSQELKNLVNPSQIHNLEVEVKNYKDKLTTLNQEHCAKLQSIDKHNLTGARAEQNLVEDMKKIGKVENENIVDIAKKLKAGVNPGDAFNVDNDAYKSAKKALFAQVELEVNKKYIEDTSTYLDGIKKQVKTIGNKIEYRRQLADSSIKMTASASKMGTAGLTLDAKNQEADARLLESFGHVMDRVISLMSKTSNSYTDEFAKFLKELRDAIIQQLVTSSQLLTRYYGTR